MGLADLTRGPELSSRTSIRGAYGRLCEACSVVDKSVPSWVADLLSLAICGVEVVSRASILEVRIGALKSTLSSNSTRIGELEPQLEPKRSNFEEVTEGPE